jgi:hypothetical protein
MYFTRILLSIVFACLLPLSAYAKSDPPDISGVMVMNDLDAIMVEGVNFAVETPLLVTLGPPGSPGDITADCTLEDDTLITCEFPAGLPPAGDYRLIVLTGSGKNKGSNGYDLTIGAVGPIGPQGDAGTDGADGTSCSITECVAPGEATITCGIDSVLVPCIPPPPAPLLTCPCWDTLTEPELLSALNATPVDSAFCRVGPRDYNASDDADDDPYLAVEDFGGDFALCTLLLPSLSIDIGPIPGTGVCVAEAAAVIPLITWCDL